MNVISVAIKDVALFVEDQEYPMPITAKNALKWKKIGMAVLR